MADANGKQCEQLLPGVYESMESKRAWGRFLLEQEVAPKGAPEQDRDNLSLVEVLDAYHTHATQHYRGADGKPTSELAEVTLVIRALREAYGNAPVADSGPIKLKAVRQVWVGREAVAEGSQPPYQHRAPNLPMGRRA